MLSYAVISVTSLRFVTSCR